MEKINTDKRFLWLKDNKKLIPKDLKDEEKMNKLVAKSREDGLFSQKTIHIDIVRSLTSKAKKLREMGAI